MTKDPTLYQSLESLTVSYLKEISGLKKELTEKQLEIDRKVNELARAKLRIGELESRLGREKPN